MIVTGIAVSAEKILCVGNKIYFNFIYGCPNHDLVAFQRTKKMSHIFVCKVYCRLVVPNLFYRVAHY